jgi:hypothetical protein
MAETQPLSPLSVLNPTPRPDPVVVERAANVRFGCTHAAPRFREALIRLHRCYAEINRDHFDGRLVTPHLSIGRTSPRRNSQCRRTTNYGGQIDITLSEGVVFGTSPMILRPSPSAGYLRYERDLLLGETAKQRVLEELGTDEEGYGGYGPLYAAEATRIGEQLGLPAVAARRRGNRDTGRATAAGWPWAFRPAGYYLGDVRLGNRRAPGSWLGGVARTVTATANEYYLFLLVTGQSELLRRILELQVEFDRAERMPELADAERGPRDERGNPKPVPALPAAWVRWNDDCPARMAEFIADRRAFEVMPILADALEDAGCTDNDVLDHCRLPAHHSANCWVLRAIRSAAEASRSPSDVG